MNGRSDPSKARQRSAPTRLQPPPGPLRRRVPQAQRARAYDIPFYVTVATFHVFLSYLICLKARHFYIIQGSNDWPGFSVAPDFDRSVCSRRYHLAVLGGMVLYPKHDSLVDFGRWHWRKRYRLRTRVRGKL